MEAVAKDVERFCIFEDDLPRSGGRWPEYAATMILCFDRWENDMAIGSLWTFFQSTPIPFHGLDNLLFIMDAMMDQAEQPMPWMARRHIKEQTRPHSGRRPQFQNPLSFKPGLLATVSVRIYTRQHATMQGALRVEGNREACFAVAWNCCISFGKLQNIHLLLDLWNRNVCDMGETLSAFCHARDCTELLAQWDRQANLPLTPETIPYGSTKKVWWQCEKGHCWQVTVNNRTSSHTDCPYCSGRAAWPGETDLASRFPELAREWHPTKNLPLTPECVLPGSEKKVWWRCGLGHVWRATIHSRTDGCGCPVCANRAVAPGINDLASQFPRLAKEWHPTKNGTLTPQKVTFGTNAKFGGGVKKDTSGVFLFSPAPWTGLDAQSVQGG